MIRGPGQRIFYSLLRLTLRAWQRSRSGSQREESAAEWISPTSWEKISHPHSEDSALGSQIQKIKSKIKKGIKIKVTPQANIKEETFRLVSVLNCGVSVHVWVIVLPQSELNVPVLWLIIASHIRTPQLLDQNPDDADEQEKVHLGEMTEKLLSPLKSLPN